MKSDNSDCTGESDGGHLLEEIEAISKALYLHKAPKNAFLYPSDSRLKSHLTESKLKFNQGSPREELLLNDRRSSSAWNWKKSLKALAHIHHRKFNCLFYLNVHSIEGLPENCDGYSLTVHWKRKDEVLQTRPSKVFQGMAEFDETLIHKCSVYGGRSLANHSAKYEPKLFLIYVSMLGAPRLDIGKHWVDLTRILPLTLEELEGERTSGNWSTSFQLKGIAGGASLNVSFSFLVTRDESVKLSGHENVVQLLKLLQNRSNVSAYGARFTSTNLNRFPGTDGNILHGLKYGSIPSIQSVDMATFHEPNPRLELTKSINLLYRKMDEGDQDRSEDSGSEFFKQLKSRSDEEHKSDEEFDESGYDCGEFSIIECGIELAVTEEDPNLDESTVKTIDGSKLGTIYLDEIIEDDKAASENKLNNMLKDAICDIHVDDSVVDDFKHEENNLRTEKVTGEERRSAFDHKWTSGLVEIDPPLAVGELREQENDVESKENCGRSLSLDDSIESEASDFLNMLGLEHGSSRFSDADPLSPRERLLRQFEEESLVFGNSVLDFTTTSEDWQDFGSVDLLESACENSDEDFDLSSIIYVAEEGQEEVHQSLRSRRNAKILEDLETEVLMREWGLNEMDFQHSPRYSSSGFGSPIELLPEEPLKLPSLGEGFGPFLKMKSGGFLRSMNPSLFQNIRNGQSLIVQCSGLVVLPAEIGYDIMEISQNLAMAGIENLSILTNKLMPLDDITRKTLQQMMLECASSTMVPERESMLQNKLSNLVSFCGRKDPEGLPSRWNYSLRFPLLDSLMNPDLVSPDDLAFLAMDKIQTLLIEGLRIQCGMTDDKASSRINARPSQCVPAHGEGRSNLDSSLGLEEAEELQFTNWLDTASDVVGLMDLSLTLDDWLRLDAGIINDDGQNGQHIMKILMAHGATYADIVGRLSNDINSGTCSKEPGLLETKLVVALMVQLRDHVRNYEPVGGPMMCIMQVERFLVDSTHGMILEMSNDKKENEPLPEKEGSHKTNEEKANKGDVVHAFKISAIHLLGVNSQPNKMQFWGTTTQQQSGSRWLHSSGMGRNFKLPLSKSRAIVRPSLLGAEVLPSDVLWSISSHIDGEGSISALTSSSSHNRNPDVVILN